LKISVNQNLKKIVDIAQTVSYDIIAIQVVAGYGGVQAVAKLADELNRKGVNGII
jgi:2-methylisocitrate lyase-like PEP mutase family enzyme